MIFWFSSCGLRIHQINYTYINIKTSQNMSHFHVLAHFLYIHFSSPSLRTQHERYIPSSLTVSSLIISSLTVYSLIISSSIISSVIVSSLIVFSVIVSSMRFHISSFPCFVRAENGIIFVPGTRLSFSLICFRFFCT